MRTPRDLSQCASAGTSAKFKKREQDRKSRRPAGLPKWTMPAPVARELLLGFRLDLVERKLRASCKRRKVPQPAPRHRGEGLLELLAEGEEVRAPLHLAAEVSDLAAACWPQGHSEAGSARGIVITRLLIAPRNKPSSTSMGRLRASSGKPPPGPSRAR